MNLRSSPSIQINRLLRSAAFSFDNLWPDPACLWAVSGFSIPLRRFFLRSTCTLISCWPNACLYLSVSPCDDPQLISLAEAYFSLEQDLVAARDGKSQMSYLCNFMFMVFTFHCVVCPDVLAIHRPTLRSPVTVQPHSFKVVCQAMQLVPWCS